MSEVRLIDANALKYKNLAEVNGRLTYVLTAEEIDNAPTVELTEEQAIDKLHETGWLIRHDKEMTERPQGECRTCRHRDPEDKKCDCGGLERQGCLFPVSDDYFCKFYEKGGAEE